MLSKKWLSVAVFAVAAVSSSAFAGDRDFNTAIGAVTGAVIGNVVGGRDGAIFGGVVGAVIGANAEGHGGQGYYQQPQGYYQAPQQAYYPARTYYQPVPVHYSPRPVYVEQTRYVRPGYGHDRHEWRDWR